MLYSFQKNILISSLILLFLAIVTEPSYAVLSMSEVRYLFGQETGRLWEEVAPEEQKNFLRDVRGLEGKQTNEFKEDKKKQTGGRDRNEVLTIPVKKKDKAPFHVRASFEIETGIEWEDATAKEQKVFWRDYKTSEAQQKREEKKWLKNEKLREQKIKREQKQKKRDIKLKRKVKDREEKLKRKEIRKKREEEKKRKKKAKQKAEAFRREFKDKHERSKQR